MLSTLLIVLPIFALILVGWMARRIGVFGPNATIELNRFVVYLALPALLFDIVAHARWADIWQPGFIAAFGLSSVLVFALTLAIRLRPTRHLADATIDGLNAAYGNTGFMGVPLALLALGPASLPAATIATIMTVCVTFALAIVVIEAGLQSEASRGQLVMKVATSLARNPLLVAPAVAALIPLAGWSVPEPIEVVLKMLGGSASPCALVALGLFLAEKREGAGDAGSTALLVALKLFLQPAIAWVIAALIFKLPPLLIHAAVLLAALPTGTGPFMLAEYYQREAQITAKVILVSTVLSVLTLSAYLAWGV